MEGTYTSGDREGITVSHAIDFGTMKIKRNYLYKVRIALDDPAGDTYGTVTHAINVKDWTSGVTLAWAGDENLYNNSQEANFTVTGTERKLRNATVSDLEQHLVLPYNAEKSATFYVTSTSTKSGLSLTCPAMSVAATAEELALNTSADNYQCKIDPLPEECVYNEDGTFIQKWKVIVRESALSQGSILTFTLQNALNSALSTSFEVIGAPFASEDDIQPGDVYYANGYWSRPADMEDCITRSGTTAIGVVAPMAAKKTGAVDLSASYAANLYSGLEAGDVYYAAGYWSSGNSSIVSASSTTSAPIGVIFKVGTSAYDTTAGFSHAYVIALKNAVDNCTWAPSGTTYATTQATDVMWDEGATKSESVLRADVWGDLDGYKHCLTAKEKVTTFTTSNLPAMYYAENYESTVHAPSITSGWYLPSIGQWYEFFKFAGCTDPTWQSSSNLRQWVYSEGESTSSAKIDAVFTSRGLTHDLIKNKSQAGNISHYWSSSEKNTTIAYHIHFNGGQLHLHANISYVKVGFNNYPFGVRTVLAF